VIIRLVFTLLFLVSPLLVFSQTFFEKAQIAEQKGDFNAVLSFIEKHLETAPTKTLNEAYLIQFRAYHRLGYEAYQSNNTYEELFRNAVSALLNAQKHAETVASRQFIEQEIQQRYAQWIDLGTQRFNAANYQEASFWFSLCAHIQPLSQEVNELQIFTLAESGDFEEALKQLIEFEEKGFQSTDVFSIGLQISAQEKLFSDQTVRWSENVAQSTDSIHIETLIFYDSEASSHWIEKKQLSKARYHLQRLIQFTDDEWFKISLAKLYLDSKLVVEARYQLSTIFLPEIEEARVLDYYHHVSVEISRVNNDVSNVKSWKINHKLEWMKTYFQAKEAFLAQNYQHAEILAQQAIDDNPNYAPLLFLRAKASYQLAINMKDDTEMSKKIMEIVPFFERSYVLDSELPGLKESLRVLYESMGDAINAERFQ
jgi:tetratricopeptide (TPR) repeat protein